MINVIFNYNQKKILIQCNLEDKMRIICQKFASKVNINVDSKIYLYNNKPLSINPELDKTLGQQIDTSETGDKEIIVLDDPDKEYTIKLHFEGEVKEVKYKQGTKNESVFEQIGNYFSLKRKSFFALCNGVLIGGDDDLNSQLSTQLTLDSKEINLLIESELEEENVNLHENIKENENIIDKQKSLERNESKEDQILIRRKKTVKLLLKIYIQLLIQFICIGFFVSLGFYTKFSQIFIKDLESFLWSSISLILLIFFISLFIFKKRLGIIFTIFNIIIYIPCIIILCFLFSYFIDNGYILSILLSILLDILSVIFFVLIFKRYIGYGYLFFALILNTIMISLCYVLLYKEKDLGNIYVVANLASTFIIYILFFNNISKKKLDVGESIAAVYYFDYSIFAPFAIIALIFVCLIIIIPLLLISLLLLICVFALIIDLIQLFGTSLILITMIIKVLFYLCTKRKNNLNKKIN